MQQRPPASPRPARPPAHSAAHSPVQRAALFLGAAALLALPAAPAAAQTATADELVVSATRVGPAAAANVTIITTEEIERSPAQSIPDLLALEAGIQVRDLYGGTGGMRATVDLRGFGETGTQNTLILLNGRRLNDIDNLGVAFAAIPKESIERIEILRGHAAAVLYGEGAVGGAINIITRKPPLHETYRFGLDGGFGSHGYRTGGAFAETGFGSFGANIIARYVGGHGFRDNNRFVQRTLRSEFRLGDERTYVYLWLGLDDQSLGLPGARAVNPGTGVDLVRTDPRGATTPDDEAKQRGITATAGVVHNFDSRNRVVVDFGYRRNQTYGAFLDYVGFPPFFPPFTFNNFVDTKITSLSFTPRAELGHDLFGRPIRHRVGIDYYHTDYESERARVRRTPTNVYTGTQHSLAFYGQSEMSLTPSTQLVAGGRINYFNLTMRDRFDPTAPGAFGQQRAPFGRPEWQWAFNLGIEQRVYGPVSVYVRGGRAFRRPTVDERIGGTGVNFDLRTQTSWDVEGGVKASWEKLDLQAGLFYMRVSNELVFNPETFQNVNQDASRRFGLELSAVGRPTDWMTMRGSLTWTDARFTGGTFRSNTVPLVSPLRLAGSVTVRPVDWLALTGSAAWVAPYRMDNDKRNFQPKVRSYTLLDFKARATRGRFFAEATVNNLLDQSYFTYAVASATTQGVFNAYPAAGRTFLLRAGMTFGGP